jgi:hypothetical protein
LRAFPGAEGFGAEAVGGRGGRALLVTTLADSGPGSLRAACEADGPRTIIFRISGNIELQSDLRITKPFITLAGQTAPGEGICLKNSACIIATHDVVVRYLRFRPGDGRRREMDSLSVVNAQNVLIDHCSASWSVDETLSVTGDSRNVTVQWCMITESLNRSFHQKGAHGYGSLIVAKDGGYSFHHNLYAHHNSRNPRPGTTGDGPGLVLDFRNHLIYDFGARAGYSSTSRVCMNYVGNFLKPGPSTRPDSRAVAFLIGGPMTSLFLADNFLDGHSAGSRDNRLLVKGPREMTPRQLTACFAERLFTCPAARTDSPQEAYRRVLAQAGAILPKRDAVDSRIAREVQTGTGRIINSQDEVGGWPELKSAPAPPDQDADGLPDAWEQEHRLDAANGADGPGDADRDGYTNLEEFLNGTDPRRPEAP